MIFAKETSMVRPHPKNDSHLRPASQLCSAAGVRPSPAAWRQCCSGGTRSTGTGPGSASKNAGGQIPVTSSWSSHGYSHHFPMLRRCQEQWALGLHHQVGNNTGPVVVLSYHVTNLFTWIHGEASWSSPRENDLRMLEFACKLLQNQNCMANLWNHRLELTIQICHAVLIFTRMASGISPGIITRATKHPRYITKTPGTGGAISWRTRVIPKMSHL